MLGTIFSKAAAEAAEGAGKALASYSEKGRKKLLECFHVACIRLDIDLRNAYDTYLTNIEKRYSKVKTLIYNKVPMDLYSFYESVGLNNNSKEEDTNNINNVLNISNNIIITGTGGIGKTTMFRHFLLNTPKETNYVPVMIELRSLNSMDFSNLTLTDISRENPLEDMIYDILKKYGFSWEKEHFIYSLKDGCYVFLFDGFDELRSDISEKAAAMIKDLADKYNKNHYIVSSRPSDEFISWNNFTELQTLPLNKDQAKRLIGKLQKDEETKTRFIQELDKKLFDKHKSFAQNPLLLTILFMTYESNARIPETLCDFYERAFMTLFDRHDGTKENFVRDIKTKLSYDDFKRVFSHFCFQTYFFNSVFEFTDVTLKKYMNKSRSKIKDKYPDIAFEPNDMITDLTKNVCMLQQEGLNYTFVHRSFQEYFAALYVRDLSDEKQQKLLITHLHNTSPEENFWIILHDMQPDRFNCNLIVPEARWVIENIGDTFDSYIKCIINLKEYFEEDHDTLVLLLKKMFSIMYLFNFIIELNNVISGYNNDSYAKVHFSFSKTIILSYIMDLAKAAKENRAEDIKNISLDEEQISYEYKTAFENLIRLYKHYQEPEISSDSIEDLIDEY